MAASSALDVRPKWWSILVVVTNIAIPLFATIGIFVAPETMLLGGPMDQGGSNTQAIFRDTARSMACGNLLAIAVACVAVTTKKVETLALSSTLLVLYLASLWLMMGVVWIVAGYLDSFGYTMDSIMLLLQLYMIWKIHNSGSHPWSFSEEEASTPMLS